MNNFDFFILFGTLGFIVIYGVWKTWGNNSMSGYLKGDNSMKWGTIGLSVMATQASAITFLSTPGQGFEDGLDFVQNYFGLPLALIIVSAVFIPIYYKLKVYTAYEFLENRFDIKTRILGAFLFLLQRGLQAGITIYAPAIILSTILGWSLSYNILLVGILVIIYTVSGGTKAVSLTHKYQMGVIMIGMFIAFYLIIDKLPPELSFINSIKMAGTLGKINAVDFSFDFSKRYTFWSGITGGLFLALSYFGTDQSQVQRYLTGTSITESRLGLMFNAVLKIPMQFFILFVGVMVFVFYQFVQPPVNFKEAINQTSIERNEHPVLDDIEEKYNQNYTSKKMKLLELNDAYMAKDIQEIQQKESEVKILHKENQALRDQYKEELAKINPEYDAKDMDYVFISFIMRFLPHGIIGLLLAVIFSAAMSSTSSELNALASTTIIDFYKRLFKKEGTEKHYVAVSKWLTAIWGGIAILFAFLADQSENLIEAVNIVGSIFYGTILGIFIAAFFVKRIKGSAIFYGAIIAELGVIALHTMTVLKIIDLGYLWYNAIGLTLTVSLGYIFSLAQKK